MPPAPAPAQAAYTWPSTAEVSPTKAEAQAAAVTSKLLPAKAARHSAVTLARHWLPFGFCRHDWQKSGLAALPGPVEAPVPAAPVPAAARETHYGKAVIVSRVLV